MLPLSSLQEGALYHLPTKWEGLEPGYHLVMSKLTNERREWYQTDSYLYTVHLPSGKAQSKWWKPEVTPVETPLRPSRARRLLRKLQIEHPSRFAAFGADRSLGTDPEVFAVRADGSLLPAWKYLRAKEAEPPREIYGNGTHFNTHWEPYWDGFQAEFNVRPQTCIAHLTDYIQAALNDTYLRARKVDPEARLVGSPVLPLRGEDITEAAPEHLALGCLPSENAYGDRGKAITYGRLLPVRFAGFHIHVELSADRRNDAEFIVRAVRMMDRLCGLTSVVALQGLEHPLRREYYGLAGEYRRPKHGVEYRTISSAVLWHPALVHLVFNLARVAVQLTEKGLDSLWEGPDSNEDVREAINHLDTKLATSIISANRRLFLGVLAGTYWEYETSKGNPRARANAEFALDQIILPGVRAHLGELDLAKAWSLGPSALADRNGWDSHSSNYGAQFQSFIEMVRAKSAKTASKTKKKTTEPTDDIPF